jgi:hypothetical protein
MERLRAACVHAGAPLLRVGRLDSIEAGMCVRAFAYYDWQQLAGELPADDQDASMDIGQQFDYDQVVRALLDEQVNRVSHRFCVSHTFTDATLAKLAAHGATGASPQ